MKGWWFTTRAKQLFCELYPDKVNADDTLPFMVLKHWFRHFLARWDVSPLSTTNRAQEQPDRKTQLVLTFYRSIQEAGQFPLSCIENMDWAPALFGLSSGKTYADKDSRTVWCRSVGGSEMEKRQATVQLTICADGEPRVRPVMIFCGTGQRVSRQEKQQYDHRVTVVFQENAWCDEATFLFWACHMWRPDVATRKLLVLDGCRAPLAASARSTLNIDCKMTMVAIGGSLTSVLRPLGVFFSRPFKTRTGDLFNDHLSSHLDDYTNGTIPAGRRGVLMCKVGWPGLDRLQCIPKAAYL